MRELAFPGPGEVEWREAPAPTLQSEVEALLRPIAVATCDLDAAIVRGQSPFTPPFGLGHEFRADVLETGAAVRTVSPGNRVAVSFQPCCGTCVFCGRGLTANCLSVPRTSMYGVGAGGGNWGGALSDVVRVPFADHMLVKLPAGIPPGKAASASDNLADGYRAVAPHLPRRPGAAVLVLSGGLGGSIPLYAAGIAVRLGAERVDFYDSDAKRIQFAKRLGANASPIDKWPARLGSYAITVDASWDPHGLACALRSTEPGGVCTSTSIYFGGLVPVPMTEMYMKGITFGTGRVHSRGMLPEILTLIETGRFDPDLVRTETASWDDAPQAILGYTVKLVILREAT